MSEQMMQEYRKRYRQRLGTICQDTLEHTITVEDVDLQVSQIVNKVVDLAAEKAVDAGYSGSHSDNGAGQMIDTLKAWIAGMEGRMLEHFDKVRVEILKDTNADQYAEYQRLKKVFGE